MSVEGASVDPLLPLKVARIGDYGAAEVKRIHVVVKRNLGGIGIKQRLKAQRRIKLAHKSGYARRLIVEATFHLGYLRRIDKRFIALDVYYHIGIGTYVAIGLITSVGAAAMGCSRHDNSAAETFHRFGNTVVVGRHIHFVKLHRCTTIHPLYHRHSANVGERFSGET